MDRAGGKNNFGISGVFEKSLGFFEGILGTLGGPGFVLVNEVCLVDPYELTSTKKGHRLGGSFGLGEDAFDIIHPVGPPVDDFPGEVVGEILCPLIKNFFGFLADDEVIISQNDAK
jgi:hypothetical protein